MQITKLNANYQNLNTNCQILQRLCEELEYCELIEKAVDLEDPYERMVGIIVAIETITS